MEIEIESLKTYNMSNLEATHTFNSINTGNNKANILKCLSEYLNNRDANTIFMFNSSFNISSNYSKYFDTGNQLSLNNLHDLQNIMYMGKLIPFEHNEELISIQYLLDEYKYLNYILNNFKNHTIKPKKIVSSDIIKYLKINSKHGIYLALKIMFDDYKKKLKYIYTNQKNSDEKLYTQTLQKLTQKANTTCTKYTKYLNASISTTTETFMNNFNSFSRPIIGTYEKETRTIKIINYEQMFEKGNNYPNKLGLISINRNSPIKITINTTGITTDIFNYLMYSKNNATTSYNDDILIKKILNSSNSNINNLAKKVLNKIKEATKNNKVSIQEINNPS